MPGPEYSDMRGDAPDDSAATDAAPILPSDNEATALVSPVRMVFITGERSDGDLAERPRGDSPDGPYGIPDPDASHGTPHLDEAKELVGTGERYNAFGGNFKHDARVAGAAAVSGAILFALMSSSGPSMSAQERDTTQIAAAAEYPAGSASTYSALQNLNIERIPPAADPKDQGAVDKDIQAAEAEGAANMHGGSSGVTAREFAIEAFATDKVSDVAVPGDAKEAMTAGTLTEQAGGDPAADYMKAADDALGAAEQASAGGSTIKVPIAEKK